LLDAGFIEEVYHLDWLMKPFLYQKRIKIGGCVLNILISTRHSKKIHSACHELIKSWTPCPVAAF
jgi:hypothetical protein